jgi:hypothetical protein
MRLPGQALQAGCQALAAAAGPLQRTGRRAEGRSLQAGLPSSALNAPSRRCAADCAEAASPVAAAVTLTWVRFNQALLLS